MRALRLGTRRSKLAMAQSGQVAERIRRLTGRSVELVEVVTTGDISREHLTAIGGTGVFVSALRDELLAGRIDLAVHSLKDLPTAQPPELALAAVPGRADPRDALVARDGLTLEELLRAGAADGSGRPARVGTGSPRRMSQLHVHARSLGCEITTVPIRGNVDTRIGYVRAGELDAVVLASAGLHRVGSEEAITDLLDPDTVLPAPGQGALAVECVASRDDLVAELGRLDDPPTRIAVTAERALLSALEAGCSAPVAALADHREDEPGTTVLHLRGAVGTTDGATSMQLSTTGPVPASDGEATARADRMGRDLAAEMLAKGAAGLMGERAQ
ncbi:hydroxymethylbilane synthase [Streptomyces alkaliphilus]|uniref:hydroxymethylbilane synthase n=1 Tax=Streptomyces alkaliphilus TaxID=1472722 RepID=UPI00117EF04E|nr:hydroxymethylbilane synthase [Streptomyces alkaliphilus]MQS07556.1 hydroxymethylbilane synthase [Streptomyces alkaliphilus]